MNKNIGSHIYKSEDLGSPVDTKDKNSYLEREYNASIFDFAYLLAIALAEEFLPPHHKRSYFGCWKDLKKWKRILENTKKYLPDSPFFKRLLAIIDENLKDIYIGLRVTRKPSGSPVGKKTKLILLWTHILRKPKIVSEKINPAESRFRADIRGEARTINWSEFYKLLKWFYLKLEKCSYSFYIMPKKKKQEEEANSKSLLEKHYDLEDNTKHWYDAENSIGLYITLQRYLREDSKYLSDQTRGLKRFNIKPYPIIQVNFNLDNIEIGELRENKIVIKKISYIEKKKVPDYEEHIKKKPSVRDPTVIFPDGEEFIASNYVPPFHRFGWDSVDKFLESIKSNSA